MLVSLLSEGTFVGVESRRGQWLFKGLGLFVGFGVLALILGIVSLRRGASPEDVRVRGWRISEWFRTAARARVYLPEEGEPHLGYNVVGPRADRVRTGAWEAYHSVLAAGTNALPFLLRQAIEGDPSKGLRKALDAVVDHLPVPWGRRVTEDEVRRLAEGFVLRLRPEGGVLLSGAAPWLNDPDPRVRGRAIALLQCAGSNAPPVVEWLRKTLATKDASVEVPVTFALARLGATSSNAVPELVAILPTWQRYEPWVFVALGHAGRAAEAAVPELESRMKSAPPHAAIAAALALCQIRPDHAEAWPWLVSIAEGKAEEAGGRRIKAGQLLQAMADLRCRDSRLGSLARRVIERQSRRWSTDAQRALSVLVRLDPESAEAIVRNWMEHPEHGGEVVHAAQWLIRYRPERDYPREVLAKLARESADWRRLLAANALVDVPDLTREEKRLIRSVVEDPGMSTVMRGTAESIAERLRVKERFGETERDQPR